MRAGTLSRRARRTAYEREKGSTSVSQVTRASGFARLLVLGATGKSGRIATQLAKRHRARVVAAGRNQRIVDQLTARGADAAVRVDRPHDELAATIAAEGPTA